MNWLTELIGDNAFPIAFLVLVIGALALISFATTHRNRRVRVAGHFLSASIIGLLGIFVVFTAIVAPDEVPVTQSGGGRRFVWLMIVGLFAWAGWLFKGGLKALREVR